jgi:MFS family permease
MIIGAGVVLLAAFLWLQYVERDREPLVPFSLFRNRNFAIMNWVVASIGFGMLGLFLPLTIYLQSVLGLTALQAGLTTAPMSVIAMFVAPAAGRFSDRSGGKWILASGITLFAAGLGTVIASAHIDSSRLHLLPGLIVAGFGLGMTFAPLQTIAMREVEPRMAGAASGLINTTRQLGALIGSAAVGAVLQSQLSSKLPAAAAAQARQLPESARAAFLAHASQVGSASAEVTGQPPRFTPPPGMPADVIKALNNAIKATFANGFTNAMRPTLALPIAVMLVAAASVMLVKIRKPAVAAPAGSPGATTTDPSAARPADEPVDVEVTARD